MNTVCSPSEQSKTPNPQGAMALTVAASSDGALASKSFQFIPTQGAWVETASYGRGKLFHFRRIHFCDLAGFLNALETLSDDPLSFVLRGVPIDGECKDPQLRRTKERVEKDGTITPPTLREEPMAWVALDLDQLPTPPGVDITRMSPADIHQVAVSVLPEAFRDAGCVLNLTSKHGLQVWAGPGAVKPASIRVRLFYLLDRPLGTAELKALFAGRPVDASVFGAHQPIYTAAPSFHEAADPFPQRWFLIEGAEHVQVGEIPTIPSKTTSRTSVDVDVDEPSAAAGQPRSGRGGWRGILNAEFGDDAQKGQLGIYPACLSATASFLRTEGPDADPAPLWGEITRLFKERGTKRDPAYLNRTLAEMRIFRDNFARKDREARRLRLREAFPHAQPDEGTGLSLDELI